MISIAVIAVAALARLGLPASAPPADDAAIAAGNVAQCNDGTYSDNADFRATCNSHDGVARWLAPFGVCGDGRVIAISEDASCDDHDDFDQLLPLDYTPMPAPGDVARCGNGTHSDNTDFDRTCNSQDGVDTWLAPTVSCNDGTALPLNGDTDCGDNDGFGHLNLIDVATCADGSTSTYVYFPNTCADAEGVSTWLGPTILCQDGTTLPLDSRASCAEHAGLVTILSTDQVISPTTPGSTSLAPTTSTAAPTTSSPASTTLGGPATDAPTTVSLPTPSSPSTDAPGVEPFPITVGAEGPAVAAIQGQLGITVDCGYGNQTKQAVVEWQITAGLEATGEIDETAWALLDVPTTSGDDVDGDGTIEPDEVTLICDGDVDLPPRPIDTTGWPDTMLAFIAEACGISDTFSSLESEEPDYRYSPSDDSITFFGAGAEDYPDRGEVVFDTLICVLGFAGVPDRVLSQLSSTRALDGMQTAEWDDFAAQWTYHPDDGMNLTIWSQ